MHPSAILALALAAAATPALSLPATSSGSADASGALSFKAIKEAVHVGGEIINGVSSLVHPPPPPPPPPHHRREFEGELERRTRSKIGLAKDVVELGNGVVNAAQGIKNLVHPGRRGIDEELIAREPEVIHKPFNRGPAKPISFVNRFPVARDLQTRARSKIGLAKDVVELGNGVINAAQGIKNIVHPGRREEFVEFAARDDLVSREPSPHFPPHFHGHPQMAHDLGSRAIKNKMGLAKDVVELGNGVINAAQGVKNLVHPHRRSLDELD